MPEGDGKQRALKILAKSMFRELQARGFDETHVIALAGELIDEVTRHVTAARQPRRRLRLA
jgi:hypothetical protein